MSISSSSSSGGSFQSDGPTPVVIPTEAPPPAPGGGGCMKAFVIGCVSLIILGIVALVLLFLFKDAILNWGANVTFQAIETGVEQSKLPEADKTRIKEFVQDLKARFEAGELDAQVVAELVRTGSQVMMPGILHVATIATLDASGLSDLEKEAGRRAAERVARGGFDGTIETDAFVELLSVFENKDEHDRLTDDQLRDLVSQLESVANEYEVPDEGYEVNYAEEIIGALETALGETPKSK